MIPDSNPYNPLQPAMTPAHFFGREAVFAFFRQHLVGATLRPALVLIGRRGLGKSAVLRQLPYQLEERYVPCVVSLGTITLDGEAVLFAALADDVRLALDAAGSSTYRLPEFPDSVTVILRDWFRGEFLDVAMAALRGRHLLLALDDAHLLFEAMDQELLPDDLLDYFGDLLTTYDRLDLIFALDSAYEDRVLSAALMGDPALHIRLAELPLEDAERLVREPVADTLLFEEGVVEGVLALAGGHPFLLQSICRLLYRRSEEHSHHGPVTLEDLEAVQVAALDQADEIFSPLWNGLSQSERATLTALVRLDAHEPGVPVSFDALFGWLTGAGYAMNRTQLAAALRSLGYEGLIHTEADTYTLAAGLIADWVEANVTPPVPEEPPRRPLDVARLTPVLGLLAVLVIVGVLGVVLLSGVFDSDEGEPADAGAPTATLSLNIEATRQSDFMTMTERARPTETPTRSHTPTETFTPTATDTPTATLTPSETRTPSDTPIPTDTEEPTETPTQRPMRTPRPSRTPIEFPPTDTPAPTATPTTIPTNTPRPSLLPTLDPGG